MTSQDLKEVRYEQHLIESIGKLFDRKLNVYTIGTRKNPEQTSAFEIAADARYTNYNERERSDSEDETSSGFDTLEELANLFDRFGDFDLFPAPPTFEEITKSPNPLVQKYVLIYQERARKEASGELPKPRKERLEAPLEHLFLRKISCRNFDKYRIEEPIIFKSAGTQLAKGCVLAKTRSGGIAKKKSHKKM